MDISQRVDDDDFMRTDSLMRAAATVLRMGTNIGSNKKVVSGTCREDSVTLCPSTLQVPQDLV